MTAIVLFSYACTPEPPQYPLVIPDGRQIRLAVEAVDDGGVHFFTYKYGGTNINFFVRRDGRGKLHTHYDACYSCFKYKLGFRVEGTYIRCIACGLKYNLSDDFWDYIGPCAPIPLRSNIIGSNIVIRLKDINRGLKLF